MDDEFSLSCLGGNVAARATSTFNVPLREKG